MFSHSFRKPPMHDVRFHVLTPWDFAPACAHVGRDNMMFPDCTMPASFGAIATGVDRIAYLHGRMIPDRTQNGFPLQLTHPEICAHGVSR